MIRRAGGIQVDLEAVRKFETGACLRCLVRNIHIRGLTIDCQRVMDSLRTRRVEYGNDVMPRVGCKSLQRDAGRLPLLRRVVKHTPAVACVIGLPGEVVRISIRRLLAFKFDCLRSVRVLSWNVEIKLVLQECHRIGECRLLDEVVAAGIRRTTVNVEIR